MEDVIGYWKEHEGKYRCSICTSTSNKATPYCPYCGHRLIQNKLKEGEYIVTDQQLVFENEIYEDCTVIIIINPFTKEKCMTWFNNEDRDDDDTDWEVTEEDEDV